MQDDSYPTNNHQLNVLIGKLNLGKPHCSIDTFVTGKLREYKSGIRRTVTLFYTLEHNILTTAMDLDHNNRTSSMIFAIHSATFALRHQAKLHSILNITNLFIAMMYAL